MKVSEEFPSAYLKADDLRGRARIMTMEHAEIQMVGEKKKIVLYFHEQPKGLVLNTTNRNNIVVLYGDDTEQWRNQQVVLYETLVDFQGKTVKAIRVRGPNVRSRPAAPPPPPPPTKTAPTKAARAEFPGDISAPQPRDDMDGDEIPF
jgi:hypothetical protein